MKLNDWNSPLLRRRMENSCGSWWTRPNSFDTLGIDNFKMLLRLNATSGKISCHRSKHSDLDHTRSSGDPTIWKLVCVLSSTGRDWRASTWDLPSFLPLKKWATPWKRPNGSFGLPLMISNWTEWSLWPPRIIQHLKVCSSGWVSLSGVWKNGWARKKMFIFMNWIPRPIQILIYNLICYPLRIKD